MKKITLHIDCCDNCPFNTHEFPPQCTYLQFLINAAPQDIKNPRKIPPHCFLEDQTEEDAVPGKFIFKKGRNGLKVEIDE